MSNNYLKCIAGGIVIAVLFGLDYFHIDDQVLKVACYSALTGLGVNHLNKGGGNDS